MSTKHAVDAAREALCDQVPHAPIGFGAALDTFEMEVRAHHGAYLHDEVAEVLALVRQRIADDEGRIRQRERTMLALIDAELAHLRGDA